MTADPPARPALAWFVLLDGGVAALTVLAFSPSAHATVQAKAPLPSRAALKGVLGLTAAAHVGEAVAARRMAQRHGLPVAQWTRQTFVVGFPSLLALRRTIRSRAARGAPGPPRSSRPRHTADAGSAGGRPLGGQGDQGAQPLRQRG